MTQLKSWTLIFALLGLYGSYSQAYPNFIGYGYKSCVTCHYNAFGNGPLTDYGRALAANTIASRLFISEKTSDEDLSNRSGFLGATKLPDWWRPYAGYRGLLMMRPLDGGTTQYKYITMMGDVGTTLLFGKHFFASGDIGYAPIPFAASPTDSVTQSNIISREHYIAYRIERPWTIYAGYMDKIYGLRVPDHIAFSRAQTGNAQNDQVHGVFVHHLAKNYEVGFDVFAGDLYQAQPLQTRGASALVEFDTGDHSRLGGSILYMANSYVQFEEAALTHRLGFTEGSSLISELGFINQTPTRGTQARTLAPYIFSQASLRLARGVHFLTTFEFYTADVLHVVTQNFRFAPGIQFFPIQRVELRFDAQNSRFFDQGTVQTDQWAFLSQAHLWF